jgi:DNA-binding PadR family transcriptional regulator
MHGYQIGQMVDQFCLPGLAGITLPAIYKAIQSLEKSKYIRGEEMREGNNPPRMVFYLNPKGKKYLSEIVHGYLNDNMKPGHEWWFALMFARQVINRTELMALIQQRINCMEEMGSLIKEKKVFPCSVDIDKLPFIHKHLMVMGNAYAKAELQALKNLYDDIVNNQHEEYFLAEGEAQ